jgi:hypothetical protein
MPAELWVYGECRCGWRVLMPEGASWPRCGNGACGRQVAPPRPAEGEDDPTLGAVVVGFFPERVIVEQRIFGAMPYVGTATGPERLYDVAAVAAAQERRRDG